MAVGAVSATAATMTGSGGGGGGFSKKAVKEDFTFSRGHSRFAAAIIVSSISNY